MTHIARSSLIIAVFFGIDKVLGFIRQVLIARQFGLTYEIDVFNAANNIPDLLSALISGGALGVALIPVLSEYYPAARSPGCLGYILAHAQPGFHGHSRDFSADHRFSPTHWSAM